jgi:hypothetical protein
MWSIPVLHGIFFCAFSWFAFLYLFFSHFLYTDWGGNEPEQFHKAVSGKAAGTT